MGAVPDTPKEEEENTGEVALPRFHGIYSKVSPRVRIVVLIALLTVGLAIYYDPFSPSSQTLETESTQIRSLESQQKWDEAITKALVLEKDFPNHSLPALLQGDLYSRQGKNELAILSYKRAHEKSPEQMLIHINLLKAYLRASLKAPAEEERLHLGLQLKEALQMSGKPGTNKRENSDFLMATAQFFVDFKEANSPPEMGFILAKALQTQVAPSSTLGDKLEASTLLQTQRHQEALAPLERGLKRTPTDEWFIENLVVARIGLEDIDAATLLVENWIQVNPNNSKALLVMAYLKFNKKNFLGALPYAQKIVHLSANNPNDPFYPQALNIMGQVYWQQNQAREAEPLLKQACDLGFQISCQHELVKGKSPASVSPPTEATAPLKTETSPQPTP
jgi:tetratricopeptide (TPR) repeat protein